MYPDCVDTGLHQWQGSPDESLRKLDCLPEIDKPPECHSHIQGYLAHHLRNSDVMNEAMLIKVLEVVTDS